MLLSAAAVLLQTIAADPSAVLRGARDAQAQFERFRRAHLPYSAPSSRGGREAHIGRFRLLHDDADPSRPPDEPARIREARARLLEKLRVAQPLSDSAAWVAGQRVRYSIEQGAPGAALEAARECGAAWWCRALEGLARHAAGDYLRAEAAFDTALAGMPEVDRCRWTDASLLLEKRMRDEQRDAPCGQRDARDRLLWWLADPLFLVQGNERRSEHLARVTMTRIMRNARNAYGLSWGADLTEITLRYGWTTGWTAAAPRYGGTFDGPSIVGHRPSPGYRFLPTPQGLRAPFAAGAAAWELHDPEPREEYAPAYADSFAAFPHQSAQFRRADATLLLIAYDLRPLGVAESLAAAVTLSAGPTGPHHMVRTALPAAALMARAPAGGLIAAVEALDPRTRRAFRARYGLPLPATARVTVSDLLLLDTTAATPTRLDEAVAHALPSAHLGARRRVVLFWETYGLAADGEPVAVSVSLFRGRRRVLRLHWDELLLPAAPATGRSLLLDVSALKHGGYRLELSLAVPDQEPATSVRELQLGR